MTVYLCPHKYVMAIFHHNKKHSKGANLRAPNLRSAKQSSSQSLPVSISWKFHEYPSICYSILLVTNEDPPPPKKKKKKKKLKKIEKWTLYSKGLMNHPQNFSDCSSCHSGPILKISWKYIHLFSNVAHRRLDGRPWNSLDDYFLLRAWLNIKNSYKSVHPFP